MRVLPTNFNPRSDSGPNSFSRSLFNKLILEEKVKFAKSIEDSDIEFCLIESPIEKIMPRVTRLDGIYFNTSQEYEKLNSNIRKTYLESDSVVFQSEFNKSLISRWFGEHKDGHVILNGADTEAISKIQKADMSETFGEREIWSCASSWRPHKRLSENIRYFLEKSDPEAVLLIAGKGVSKEDFIGFESLVNSRVFYLGHLEWSSLISLYKTSTTFLHLSFLDHCPNVVVDAAASDCTIVCSSAGGTSEISSKSKVVIEDIDWDFSPIDLYNPPKLDFESYEFRSDKDINNLSKASEKYYNVMEKTIEKSKNI